MRILALDTATEAVTVALLVDDDLAERHEVAPRGHADRLLPLAQALLEDAGIALGELDAIAVGRGPGSFTGIRIGFAAAQGLALGAGIGLVPISSLHAMALRHRGEADHVIAAFDARMGEVYLGAFAFDEDPLGRLLDEERLWAPGEVELPASIARWRGVGSAFATYRKEWPTSLGGLLERTVPDALPGAGEVARLAVRALGRGEPALDPARAEPVYLRHHVADKPA